MDATRTKRALAAVAVAAGLGVAMVASPSPASGHGGPRARATLRDATGEVVGTVEFRGRGRHADQVVVELDAPAIAGLGAFHGIHVHTTGTCDPNPSGSTGVPFGSAGGHWNPTGAAHGSHSGDLPSLLVDLRGEASASFDSYRLDVTELLDAAGDGSAVVLHAGPDNFANIPAAYGPANATTLGTGDAGGRVACGVIRPAR